METVRVPLGKSVSAYALIDKADAVIVMARRWSHLESGTTSYATTSINGRTVCMHRLLMNAARNQLVDHRNGNGLDNRRSNLRIATPVENGGNIRVARGSVPFKGVSRMDGKFYAKICHNRKQMAIGFFDTAIEAALAYDETARELKGEFACTNADLGLL